MIAAAGVLIVAPGEDGRDTGLFLLRGPGSDHPWEWAFPGGQLDQGETAAEGAARECEEECGLVVEPAALGQPLTRGVALAQPPALVPESAEVSTTVAGQPAATLPVQSEDVDFTAFLHRVKAQFTPTLCDEHVGYCWAPLDHPPAPLHPGCSVSLERPSMDELGVARAMAAGRLVSPQWYENVMLWALRITGTGASYRKSINEYVWRAPELYLNDEFLARCNGLPVIWVHPKGATLNSQEYTNRSIGTVMLPYIKGDEVWGIARVYDDEANLGMLKEQVSTSPTVVFRDPDANSRVEMEDGSRVLIEGKPSLLDHVAICSAGVWDKGGAPTGVDRSGAAEPGEVLADAEPELATARADSEIPLALLGARAWALKTRTQLQLSRRGR